MTRGILAFYWGGWQNFDIRIVKNGPRNYVCHLTCVSYNTFLKKKNFNDIWYTTLSAGVCLLQPENEKDGHEEEPIDIDDESSDHGSEEVELEMEVEEVELSQEE